MERIQCVCMMSNLVKAISELEDSLRNLHGLSLNEAVIMCSIGDSVVSAGTVSEQTGLKPSHVSKILKALETCGLVERKIGNEDRRQMYFSLSEEGASRLEKLKSEQIPVPAILRTFTEH